MTRTWRWTPRPRASAPRRLPAGGALDTPFEAWASTLERERGEAARERRELVATLVAQRTEIDERMEKREERLRADCERRVEAANAALERLRLDYERRLAHARAHEERPQTGRPPPSGADGAAPRAKAGAAADTLKATYEEELGIQKAEYEDELEAQKTDYEAKLRAQQVDYEEKLRAQQVECEAKLAARQPDDGERSIDLSEIQGP